MNSPVPSKSVAVAMLFVLGVSLFRCTAALFANTYEIGPPPTIGEIQHQTLALLPTNVQRTVIGAGEWVQLEIEESEWHDIDLEFNDEWEYVGEVDDPMGAVCWMALPGNGEFDPPVGPTTIWKQGCSSCQDVEIISAEVQDSGLFAPDPFAPANITLAVLVPTGTRPFHRTDTPLGTLGPLANSMGAETLFDIQVLPDTVNFHRLWFKEVVDFQSFPWPDQTYYDMPPADNSFHLGYVVAGGEWRHNIFWDRCASGCYWYTGHLFNQATQSYEDAVFPVVQQLFFQDGEFQGQPTYFLFDVPIHPCWFSGTSFQCEVGWQSSGGQAKTQTNKGPWQQLPTR